VNALELAGIHKSFAGVVANRGIDLQVRAGQVHAIVGENGAGKSTLMHIAYGDVRADAGRIVIKGEVVDRDHYGPTEALRRGVGMVHQHFMLVGPMSVAENLALGREPRRGAFVDLARVGRELEALAARFGFAVDPSARVEDLSVGEQQRVEILKVLWRGCDVLILDEPTAVLAPNEVHELFAVLRALVADGKTVVLITHKLDEVVEIAERVTVMRAGQVVDELTGALSTEQLAQAMVGRPVLLEVARSPARPAGVVLEVDQLRVAGRGGRDAVRGVSLQVRSGEIVAIAGVVGNGQSELIDAVAGLCPVAGGAVRLGGDDITAASVRGRHRAGLAHVPEDRHTRGLVLDFDVADNLILGRQHEFAGWAGLERPAIAAHAGALIRAFDIRPADPGSLTAGLSGGNQQKVVIAREVSRPGMRLLLCAQPTRGVDVGAIELIYRRIVAARDQGTAVLLVSAELAEIQALADRALVMYGGQVVDALTAAELAAADAFDRIGRAMTGAGSPAKVAR
jgi:general nucleoside transport system ATP-binding protein